MRGWAVLNKETDEIDLRTVSPTIRGAQVNWIYLKGVTSTNEWSDAKIDGAFNALALVLNTEIIEVEVTAAMAV